MELHHIGEAGQELAQQFNRFIQPHRSALWSYCKILTGSPWDAEDLLQETLLRAYASLSLIRQPLTPRTYLFRIATNLWMDICRRTRCVIEDTDIEQNLASFDPDMIDIRDAIEVLVRQLTPRQAAIFLLKEVFQFSSLEIAEIIGTTEGAVNAALHRGKMKLKQLNKETAQNADPAKHTMKESEIALVEQYMKAFVKSDFEAIGKMLAEQAANEVVGVGIDIGKRQIRENSMGDWQSSGSGPELQAELTYLWGKPAVIYTILRDEEPKLWDVTTVEIEEGRIVKHRSYYFCKDFLKAVAMELQIQIDEEKELFGFPW